jgi:acyl-CoA dehydrogenase
MEGGNAMDSISTIVHEQADRLFQQHVGKEVLTAADHGEWPAALWRACEDAGLPAAMVPESAGGVELAAADVARLIRRSAYYSAPLPLAETIVANRLWVDAGGDILTGAVTLAPTNPRDDIKLNQVSSQTVLHGTAHSVPWGVQAERALVVARDNAGQAFLCLVGADRGKARRRRNVAYEPRDDIDLGGVVITASEILPAPAYRQDYGLMVHGAAIRVQQIVGGMERCLDYALAYANERVQFGRPIGKFQAIQHMLAVAAGHFAAASAAADMLLESERFAADAFAVAIAKSRGGEAAGHVAAICHQVHGAMGFTQEHPLHFATRRLWAWRDEWGAEFFWQERIGRLVCAQGGEGFWPLLVDSPTVAAG